MYLIAGLGNPGLKYVNTRHNVGFEMLDAVAAYYDIKVKKVKHKALIGEGEIAGERVVLAKPQTYMNLSGESIREIAQYYKIPSENIIILYDEAALAVGKLRIRPNGSSAGHNGIKNIIYQLKTENFIRVRVGISAKENGDMVDFVLGKISKEETRQFVEIAKIMPDIVKTIISSGYEKAMNLYN
ncbi:MAG: aminoacyl-tRNA hydrolase [Eubacteriales bacterium]|nr:aminoacyl-tRNA hydrolase [Eubacteriales bacterium]